jgi:hypothetical protein
MLKSFSISVFSSLSSIAGPVSPAAFRGPVGPRRRFDRGDTIPKSKRDSGDKKTVVLSLGGQRDNSFFIEEPPRSLPSDENLSFCFFHVEETRYCALCHGFAGLQATKYQRNKTPVSLAHHLPFFFYRGNPTVFSCRGNNGGTPVRVFFVWFVVFFCRGNLDRRIVCLFFFFFDRNPCEPTPGRPTLRR